MFRPSEVSILVAPGQYCPPSAAVKTRVHASKDSMGIVLEASGCPIGGQALPEIVEDGATFRWLPLLMSKRKSTRPMCKKTLLGELSPTNLKVDRKFCTEYAILTQPSRNLCSGRIMDLDCGCAEKAVVPEITP